MKIGLPPETAARVFERIDDPTVEVGTARPDAPKKRIADESRLCFRTLAEATTPKNGYVVMLDHWWVTCPERGLVFYRSPGERAGALGSPQCNRNESITRTVIARLWPQFEVTFVPLVYLPMRD